MAFTGLETASISFISSVLVGAIVHIWKGKSFVEKSACRAWREGLNNTLGEKECRIDERIEALEKKLSDHIEKTGREQARQYRMLRALVLYSTIPAAKQTEILNDDGQGIL